MRIWTTDRRKPVISWLTYTAKGYSTRIYLLQWRLLGALEGRCEETAKLLDFVDAAFANSGDTREPTEQELHEHLSELLEAALPVDQIQARPKEGAKWSEAAAVAFALDHLDGDEASSDHLSGSPLRSSQCGIDSTPEAPRESSASMFLKDASPTSMHR
jgi:hypothetical protein